MRRSRPGRGGGGVDGRWPSPLPWSPWGSSGPPARRGADVLQDLGGTYQKTAEQLAAAFPRVELRVTAVTGITIRVEGPAVESLRPGLELTLFRRGEMFRHPVTNQPLGHAEQVLGTLVVTAVEPGAATGRLVPAVGRAAPAPIPGDGARITAGRLPVAVLPTSGVQAAFDSADQTQLLLVARFSAILEKTGRFLSVDPQRVLDLVSQTRGSSPSPLEVARRLGGVAVVSSRLVREGTTRVLETDVDLRTDRRDARVRPRAADSDELPAALRLGGDPRARAPVPAGWAGARARARRPRRRRAHRADRGRRAERDRLPDDRGRQPGRRGGRRRSARAAA